jgi:hypothetical protein
MAKATTQSTGAIVILFPVRPALASDDPEPEPFAPALQIAVAA